MARPRAGMRKLTQNQTQILCEFYGTEDIRAITNYLMEQECQRIGRIYQYRIENYKGESNDRNSNLASLD